MKTQLIDECERVAYRSWTNHHAGPAYLRGIPTWVWQAALCRRKTKRLAAVAA